MQPIVHDEEIAFEGGAVRRRTAYYGYGRVERWIEPIVIESFLDRRLASDGGIGIGGDGRLLPDRIEMSVQHENGLWSGVDVTDGILGLDREVLQGIRDGDAATLPRGLAAHDRFEVVGAICAYFGVLPDFDARGMRVPAMITDEILSMARCPQPLATPRLR